MVSILMKLALYFPWPLGEHQQNKAVQRHSPRGRAPLHSLPVHLTQAGD